MIYTTTEIRKHTESEKMSQKKATNALFFSSVPSVRSVVEKKIRPRKYRKTRKGENESRTERL